MNAALWGLLLFSSAVVFGCCVLLVFNHDYRAGIVGKVGLAFVALAAFTRAMGLLEHGLASWVSPPGVMLWLGLAAFLGRHAAKYLLRSAKKGPSWYERAS